MDSLLSCFMPHQRPSLYDYSDSADYAREIFGAFGEARLYRHALEQNYRAVKRVPLDEYYVIDLYALNFNEKLNRSLKHENIVQFYGSFIGGDYRYLTFERVTGRELYDALQLTNAYSTSHVRDYMRQILSAVSYCHGRNIILRRLAPRCFMLTMQSFTVKLLDARSAIKPGCALKGRYRRYGICDHTVYRAPEVRRNEKYWKSADVYSCGVILYNLLSGVHPDAPIENPDANDLTYEEGDFPGEEWLGVSDQAKCLVSVMMRADKRDRVRACKALNHAFFTDEAAVSDESKRNVLHRLEQIDLRSGYDIDFYSHYSD